VGALGVGLGVVAVGDLLGQVLGQVADAPGGILRPGEHALGIEPSAETGHVVRLVAELVKRLIPGRQDLPGGRVHIVAGMLIPHRYVIPVEFDLGRVWPPDLMVGRGQDAPDLGAGDGAAHSDMDVRSEPFLRFDGGEVLHVVAEVAAQVLDEPVKQRGERQGVPSGPVILVRGRVGGRSVLADPAVGRAGQGHEQRRAEGLAVRGGVSLADRAGG
jgi:hypothetical protein